MHMLSLHLRWHQKKVRFTIGAVLYFANYEAARYHLVMRLAALAQLNL